MTLQQIYDLFEGVSKTQPNVHTVVDEFVKLNREDIKYSAVVIQQREHQKTTIGDTDFITYNFYLGYIDRLVNDKSNTIEVQSTGVNIINNIIRYLNNRLFPLGEVKADNYIVFNQRFTAECAGVYSSVSISLPTAECPDYNPKYLEELNRTIVKNGDYTFTPNGVGFDKVNIKVDVDDSKYNYRSAEVDVEGLRALGWDEDSIKYYYYNNPHYDWQSDDYIVPEANITLFKNDPENKKAPSSIGSSDLVYYYKGKTPNFAPGLFNGCSYLKSIPLFDTSSVSNFGSWFRNCTSLTSIPPLNTSNGSVFNNTFDGCRQLIAVPQLDFSNASSVEYIFNDCSSLESLPSLNVPNCTNFNYAFNGCERLIAVPTLESSRVHSLTRAFEGCTLLKYIPKLNAKLISDMSYAFNDCRTIEVANFNTSLNSRPVSLKGAFRNCSSLRSANLIGFGNCTELTECFNGCSSLREVKMGGGSVNNINYAFYGCDNLYLVNLLQIKDIKTAKYAFYECFQLTSIKGLHLSDDVPTSDRIFAEAFYGCESLTDLKISGSLSASLDLSDATALDKESVKSVLSAATRSKSNWSKTLKFDLTVDDEDDNLKELISVLTSNKWTITGLELN